MTSDPIQSKQFLRTLEACQKDINEAKKKNSEDPYKYHARAVSKKTSCIIIIWLTALEAAFAYFLSLHCSHVPSLAPLVHVLRGELPLYLSVF